MRKIICSLLLLVASGSVPSSAQKVQGGATPTEMSNDGKWRIRYHFDQMKAGLTIQDFAFLSERRAVGLGTIFENGKTRPVTLLSSNAGQSWTVERSPEAGYSFFFLNDSLGWMTTGKAVWQTEEAGRAWKRLSKQTGINRLYFDSETHGYAAGAPKAVYETNDGGKTWTKLAAVDKVESNPDTTSFDWILARSPGRLGILGQSIPELRTQGYSRQIREYPNTLLSIETGDGGKTWRTDSTSMFGRIARVLVLPDGRASMLLQYINRFAYSSELYAMNYATHSSASRFHSTDIFLTDVQISPEGVTYLAGVQRTGESSRPMLPGAVHVYRSQDQEHWEEMPVDYKASAQRVILSAPAPGVLWMATDTGMVLQWVPKKP